jgi:hypothetical protein
MSDVHGAKASGLTIASKGPATGFSFSIQPTFPISNIAKPFILKPPLNFSSLYHLAMFMPNKGISQIVQILTINLY